MAADVLNPLLGFGAGVLTILSPCVLPLVPVVLGSAAQRHRMGPVVLATGLVTGFTSVGFLVAAFGSQLGIDADQVRITGALFLLAAGTVLLMPNSQERLATAMGPLVAWAGNRQQKFEGQGLYGQFAIGLLLGLVWSPCVGPTLGAATALAAQGERLTQVALTMAAFGVGIASVLLAIAVIGRRLLMRFRAGFSTNAARAKMVLGVILLSVSLAILTGFDRTLEAAFLGIAPDWLISAATRL